MSSVPGRELAPGVQWLDLGIANVYLVGEPDEPWAIVDAGMTSDFEKIRTAAARCYGADSRPEAIYLTHGHRDHSGAAMALAAYYDVPIYAHRLEMPYLTGRATYPPLDPTVGGAFGLLARFFSNNQRVDLGKWLQPLPESGDLPGLAGWQVIETPGHAPGHVSFFRPADRTLLAGDACTTMNLDWLPDIITRKPEIGKPPTPVTSDWVSARKSLKKLAALSPRVLACGHGIPLTGNKVASDLFAFAEHFLIPLRGRYVSDPARFDENGVTFLPPKPSDSLPAVAVGATVAVAAGCVAYRARKHRKSKDL